MTIHIIFTGGPCSGKTSTMTKLETKGYRVTPEAASDMIRLMQADGVKEPWAHEDFQKNVIALQKSRMAHSSHKVEIVFHDRGPWDPLMYQEKMRPNDPQEWIYNEVKELKGKYCNLVFLFENLGFCKSDGIRHENTSEALDLEQRLEATYKTHGFEVIRVKTGSVENRADFICNLINERKLLTA